jgi:hypothetical protein
MLLCTGESSRRGQGRGLILERRGLTSFSAATYTQQSAVRADATHFDFDSTAIRSREGVRGG